LSDGAVIDQNHAAVRNSLFGSNLEQRSNRCHPSLSSIPLTPLPPPPLHYSTNPLIHYSEWRAITP
jgi:SET domain-containing protein